jgi:hypothetical protein
MGTWAQYEHPERDSIVAIVVTLRFLNRNKFLEEQFAFFPFILHGRHRTRRLQRLFVAARMSLPSCYLATIWGYTDTQTQAYISSPIVACIRSTGTSLPCHCLTIKGGTHFTYPLPGKHSYTYRHTDGWEGFMKYAIEMGPGATITIPNFIKTGSGIQMLMGLGGAGPTDMQTGWR